MNDRIKAEELQASLEGEHVPLLLDVRGPEEYAAGHLPGAINIPADELGGRLAELPRGRSVVPYCNMQHPGNSRGERVTALLVERGYDARVLEGGFKAWQEDERPIEKDVQAQ